MRRIFLLSFVALSFLFVACEKESTTDKPFSDTTNISDTIPPLGTDSTLLVIGTWDIDCNASTQHEELSSPTENWIDDYTLLESGILSGEFVFRPDGTGSLTTVYGPYESYTDPLHYTINGNVLSLGNGEDYTIEKLNNQEMILFLEGTIINGSDTYTYAVRYVLDRSTNDTTQKDSCILKN